MNVETWQQLKILFHGALDLGPTERAAFLAEACHGNDDLRNQVERLLVSHDEPGAFLVSPALVNAGTILDDGQVRHAEAEERAGQRIGPYEIIREIGHGGMGTVFLAVRADDQYRKQVAIKLVKRGMDSDAILRRFMMERQILANLEHPNIAHLLEGGSTADGLPYFVMEFIEGLPITEYCDAERLNTTQRLELFREVCLALQYAHQNLVVHRDIKPSNILVTAEGVPKLLDFGIAKLLNPGWATETGEATASMVRLMTPDFASPEQFRGLSITTASDVYSLGLVLYQLLSGHHPYRLGKRRPEDVAQAILQEEPERPSTAAIRQKAEDRNRASVGEQRTSDNSPPAGKTNQQPALRNPKSLRGDIDNIVLKALRKEPERRYASVQEFSEDIRRHLEGLPVIASPATISYRAGKFVGRNRTGVVAAAIVIITLLSATAITAWQARVARRERDRAESRFDQVRKLASTVLFDYHERIKNLPGATGARKQMVTDALEYLDNLSRDSDNSPGLQRELALAYQKVGDIQGGYSEGGNTGEAGMALENYRKALAIQEKLVSQTQSTKDDRRTLAKLYVDIGSRLGDNGDFQSQEALSRRAIIALSEIVQDDGPGATMARSDLARVLFSLASALRGEGNLDGALEEYRKAAEIYETLAGEQPNKRDASLRNAALTYKTMGAIKELKQEPLFALELYRKALVIDSENAAANPNNVQYKLDTSFSYNSIASALTDKGDLKEALEHCQKALAIQEKVVGDDAKNSFARFSLAQTYRRLGDILEKLERFDEASAKYQNSIRMFEEHSKANPDNVDITARLGEIDSIFGNFQFNWALKPESYSSRVQRLRVAQTFQKRGMEIFLALKSRNALEKPYVEMLSAVQEGLKQTETELAKSSTR